MKTRIFLKATLVGIASAYSGAALACSVCITGAAGERLTDAFNWSVIFLMAMPYTIVFSIVGFFVYAYRRAAKKARAEEPAALNPASELS
jgi:heme/copper-type cytochrome/quinol oxidase subunit 2